MKFLGIIPARYASTRFPAKPLAMLGGKTVIQRVYEQVAGVKQEKTEKRKANLQTCKTCSISTPTHVRVHYNATK